MKSFGSFLLSILLLYSRSSQAFAAHKNRNEHSKQHVRGGGFTKPKHRFTPLGMTISSSHLSCRKTRQSDSTTRVRYANNDSNVLVLPPRSSSSPGGLLLPVTLEETRLRFMKKKTLQKPLLKKLDLAVFCTYLCSSLVMNLPILLLPMAATEHVASSADISSFVVSITSVAIIGGGFGKLLNGFVCQELGGKTSSMLYLMGAALFSLLFSMASPQTLGYAYAGIEFCVSMQWTALSVVFAQYYKGNAQDFARGITYLSLASTSGQLLAKFLGMSLLQYLNWRTVAQLGAAVALIGSCIVQTFVQEQPSNVRMVLPTKPFSWKHLFGNIHDSARNVLSSPLFWAIGYAHSMSMVARCSDRILGEFFQHATDLPRSICGGLTLSVTAGLVHGLVSGRAFHKLKNVANKKTFLTKRYVGAVLSALSLALVAHPAVSSLVHDKYVMAGILSILSAGMTSCMAFQFFQLPSMVAQTFGDKKAVCISWIDATGFFVNAAVWTVVGQLVATRGWSAAFCMIAALFGLGGVVMQKAITPVLEKQQG